jgi:hypothetical protein
MYRSLKCIFISYSSNYQGYRCLDLPPKESTSVIMLSLMKAPSLIKIGHHLHCSLLLLPLPRRKVIFLPHLIGHFCPFLMILLLHLLLPLFLLCSLTHHTQPSRLLPRPSLRQPPLHPLLNQTIPRQNLSCPLFLL